MNLNFLQFIFQEFEQNKPVSFLSKPIETLKMEIEAEEEQRIVIQSNRLRVIERGENYITTIIIHI